MGFIARAQGEFDSALHLFNQGLVFRKSNGTYIDIVRGLTAIGHLNNYLGQLTESTKFLRQAIALSEENIDNRFTLIPLSSLTIAHWLAGNFNKAEESIRTAIDMARHQSNINIIYPHICHIEFMALAGRYHEASIKIQQSTDWSKGIEIWPFLINRIFRIQGWISLVEKQNLEAINHLEKSIAVLTEDNEFISWSQPFLAVAYIGLEKYGRARKLLAEALSTTIDTQNYIPMLFSLPITLLVLVKDDPILAARVYEQIQRDPFMHKAQLFKDLVYKCLPEEITSLQVETVAHSDEHRESLWETARLVLEKMTTDQGI
jgi:tetratricopeptide (TPR) repeat protein